MKMTTLIDLASALDERGLSLSIHSYCLQWVIWLFPPNDPVQIIVKEGAEGQAMSEVIEAALEAWDKAPADAAPEERAVKPS